MSDDDKVRPIREGVEIPDSGSGPNPRSALAVLRALLHSADRGEVQYFAVIGLGTDGTRYSAVSVGSSEIHELLGSLQITSHILVEGVLRGSA